MTKSMKKKIVLMLAFAAITFFLAGCGDFKEPIYADTEGFWSRYIVWPIVSLVTIFKNWLGTYALSIIAVTILIRVVLLPLMIQQVKNTKKMQAVQPELQALKEKYKSKDAVTQQKYQEEMQRIILEREINPAAGCLPVLVQMPIIIGLYHAISRMNATPEIELGTFIGFQLAEPSIILAILAGLMQFVVLRTGPAMDNPQMKMMMYIMPFMIIGIGMILPAAIALYWIVGNIFMFVQNIFMYKPFQKEEQRVQPKKAKKK